MKTIDQINDEIKKTRNDFNRSRLERQTDTKLSRSDVRKRENNEITLMEKRQKLERQKTLVNDLSELGFFK